MLTGYLFILCAAACWAMIGIFSKFAFIEGLSAMEVAFWRAALAWFFFAGQAVAQKNIIINKKDVPLVAVFSLAGISLYYISYQYTIKTAGAAFASILLYTAPAWVVFCSFFIYKEKLTPLKLLSILLVIAGVFMISKTGSDSSQGAFGLAAVAGGLTSGFCYSLYYTMGKYFSDKYTSTNLFFWVFLIGALGILPFVEFSNKTPQAWAMLLGLSFFSTFLANAFYYKGLKSLETGKASIVATLEPVLAAVAAYFFFGEYFSFPGYMGAVMILTAVLLTIYKK